MRESGWIQQALGLAEKAERLEEVPVGAIVVGPEGTAIGEGFNQREKLNDPTAHAEILAIQNAARALQSWRLVGCTLVVTLEPCPMCLAACQLARIDRVVYAARDPKGGAISLGYKLNEDTRTNHRFEIDYVETPECGKILSEFFKKKRGKVAPTDSH